MDNIQDISATRSNLLFYHFSNEKEFAENQNFLKIKFRNC